MKFESNAIFSKSSVLGTVVVTVLLLLFLVLATVSQAVSGVFGSYKDRVVLAQYQGGSVSAEVVELLESNPGIELVGWASEIRQEKRSSGLLASKNGYLVYQANNSFLSVIFPDAKTSVECILCNGGVAVGQGVVVESELALGDQVAIGYRSSNVTATLGSAVRSPQLTDGLYGSTDLMAEPVANRHVAILFNRVPTAQDISFVKATISSDLPSSITVLATQLEDLNSSNVLSLLSRSSSLLTRGGLFFVSALIMISNTADMYSRRALVCSYLSIGAGPSELRRAVLIRSATTWIVAVGFSVAVVGWVQSVLAGVPDLGVVPVSFTQVGVVALFAAISSVVGGLVGLERVIRRDPADVMRALD